MHDTQLKAQNKPQFIPTRARLSAIPGSKNPDHIEEDIRIFDFELTDAEMEQIHSLDKEERFFHATYEQVEQMGRMPMQD